MCLYLSIVRGQRLNHRTFFYEIHIKDQTCILGQHLGARNDFKSLKIYPYLVQPPPAQIRFVFFREKKNCSDEIFFYK